jgi:23S rRNA (adenine2503-C2)-methyltransferase
VSTPSQFGTRYGIEQAELAALLTAWGEPRYRITQVWDALYRQRRPLEEATAVPRTLRDAIAGALPLALDPQVRQTSQDATTTKWLWAAAGDGAQVETVLMQYPTRATVCVSSQAGCAMACTFCATGQEGFERHLDAGEIVEQVLRAQHESPARVSNVVFMGMGEPLANYEAVWRSVERLHADVGISARRLTISTVGVVPGIRRLASEDLPVTLAVSLHAPDDALRSQLVPLNRRYPIAEVLDAAAEFAAARGRRVTFEYACIDGVNDGPEHAAALGRRLAAWPGAGGAHVNLIPLNPTSEFTGAAPSQPRLRVFAERLRAAGVNATVRRNRGVDIDAACGQLRARQPIPPPSPQPIPQPGPRPTTMVP